MIFVTVGTAYQFDRLLAAVARLDVGEEVVAQCGGSALRPANATCFEYLPYDEMTHLIRSARVVVTHAGAGSIMSAVANGRRPVVVARLRRFGEAVDDHQVAFARRMHALGIADVVEDLNRLGETILATTGTVKDQPVGPLAEDLGAYLTELLGAQA